MHPNIEQHWFVKTSFIYGAEVSFYYDDMTKSLYACSTTGVSCELKDFKDIYFYKDNKFILKMATPKTYIQRNPTVNRSIHYLETSLLFHVPESLVDRITILLKDKQDITFVLHSKEMLYFFSYCDESNLQQKEICIMKHADEFYFTHTDFVDLHRSFFSFVSKYSVCTFSYYESLERDKVLFTHTLEQVIVNMTYIKSSQELIVRSEPIKKYENSLQMLDEVVPETIIVIQPEGLQDYVYRYLFKLTCQYLKPKLNDEYGIDFNTDYKDVLKVVDMITI